MNYLFKKYPNTDWSIIKVLDKPDEVKSILLGAGFSVTKFEDNYLVFDITYQKRLSMVINKLCEKYNIGFDFDKTDHNYDDTLDNYNTTLRGVYTKMYRELLEN